MSFEVHCPGCGKSYTADVKMVGKRIRCRQCTEVFLVESQEGGSSSTTMGRDASRAGGAAVPGRGASTVAPAVSRPLIARSQVRPVARASASAASEIGRSDPQSFPGRAALEGWVPLGLCTIAGVWVVLETFFDNRSGAAWAPIVRILGFTAVYFLLVVPITLMATKKMLKRVGRGSPPSLAYRVIATFILPATLAYIFSTLSGIVGFVIGALVGLAAMAIVFWLLFRLEPQETANAYAIVGGTFFGASLAGAALLMLLAMLINQATTSSKSSIQLKENPLGPQFVWTVPAPPKAPGRDTTPDNSATVDSGQTVPPSGQQPSSPTTPPTSPTQPQVVQANTGTMNEVDIPNPKSADNDADPEIQSRLFGNGAAVEGDPFVKSIQDAKLPWVRWVYRPSEQGIYEQSLTPLTPSVVVALFRLPGIGGRTIECCRLTPTYRGLGALPLGDEGADATATAGRYAISDDGSMLLRLTNGTSASVAILPFRGPGGSVPLAIPADFAKSADALPATPELLGALPGRRFLVRWTSGDQADLQVYDFQASGGKLRTTIKLGQSDWPNVFGLSTDGNSFAIAEREAEQTFVVVRNLAGAGVAPMLFDTSDGQDKTKWDCAGIAFSPNGSKLAVLMEHGTDGRVRSWQVAGEHAYADGTCKVPSADEMLGQIKGRAFDWVTEGKWLVHGRTLLDASSGATFGALTDQVVTAQQMADDHTAYLSYLGVDGHPHMSVVKFNPATLNAPQSKPPGK